MGKGMYSGGHTRVTLSEDGTVWPTSEDAPAEVIVRKQPPKRRWDDAVLQTDFPEAGSRVDRKEAEYRILAEYARAYRENAVPRPVDRVPPSLAATIAELGGVIDWIAADEHRVKRFWEFVKAQEDRPPPVAPIVRAGKHKRRRCR